MSSYLYGHNVRHGDRHVFGVVCTSNRLSPHLVIAFFKEPFKTQISKFNASIEGITIGR